MLKSDSYQSETLRNLQLRKLEECSSSLDPSETGSSKGYSSLTNSYDKRLNSDSYKTVGKWSKEEDDNLIEAVNKLGTKNWKKVSALVQGRTPIQCLHRWTKILQPGLIKGPWVIEEDRRLIEWVKKEGPTKWSQCAEYISGRSGKQCRERWYNTLNPNVKKGNWTPEEDYHIFQLYSTYGSQWSKIAAYFKGRTENSIKNRFYSTLRRIATEKKKEKAKLDNNLDSNPNTKLNELLTFLPFAMNEMNIKFLKSSSSEKGLSEAGSMVNRTQNIQEKGHSQEQKIMAQDTSKKILDQSKVNIQSQGNNNFYDKQKYEEYQKMPLKALENNIEELCNNKEELFFDKTLFNLDNQINEFIDNFFQTKAENNNNLKDSLSCFGCNNYPQNLYKQNPEENSQVLQSLVQQLNELEKMLQSTKHELLSKKRVSSTKVPEMNSYYKNDNYLQMMQNYHMSNHANLFSHENLDEFI